MKEKGVERRKEKKKRKKEEEKKRKKKTLSLRSPAMRHVAQPLPMSFTAAVLTHHHHHPTPPGDISLRRHCDDECPWSWEYFQSGAVGGSPCLECPKWKRPQSAGAVGHPEIAPIRFWSPGDRNRHETLGCRHLRTHRQAGHPVALMAYCHWQ